MELLESLLNERREFKKCNENIIKNYTKQILQGLKYLHS